ncbi:MAG TPA: hypothetical protein VFC51_12270 [Chloroflexota bacterium]|nr:hypothetical protein [Chloroflexota bacterium]
MTREQPSRRLAIQLASHGEEIKINRQRADGSWTTPFRLKAALLRTRSRRIRTALNALSAYVRANQPLQNPRDVGWTNYCAILRELQESGQGLYDAIFDGSGPAADLRKAIDALKPDGELLVHIADDDVTLPFGFLFEGQIKAPPESPRRAHFDQFWLSQLRITVVVQNSGTDDERFLCLDPKEFRALYALNRAEFELAVEALDPRETRQLRSLLNIPLKEHYDWSSAREAWDSCVGNVFFVLAHSDGDILSLSDSTLDSGSFSKRFNRPGDGPLTLLILNCCLSIMGAAGGSLLSAVARPGFSGIVGTEAEILNSVALRCGTQLMWNLCANGRTLGEAIDALQQSDDPTVFPLNLFYTCYARREFRLSSPLEGLAS